MYTLTPRAHHFSRIYWKPRLVCRYDSSYCCHVAIDHEQKEGSVLDDGTTRALVGRHGTRDDGGGESPPWKKKRKGVTMWVCYLVGFSFSSSTSPRLRSDRRGLSVAAGLVLHPRRGSSMEDECQNRIFPGVPCGDWECMFVESWENV